MREIPLARLVKRNSEEYSVECAQKGFGLPLAFDHGRNSKIRVVSSGSCAQATGSTMKVCWWCMQHIGNGARLNKAGKQDRWMNQLGAPICAARSGAFGPTITHDSDGLRRVRRAAISEILAPSLDEVVSSTKIESVYSCCE